MAYNAHANTFVFSQSISNVYCPGWLLQSPENRPTLKNKPTPFFLNEIVAKDAFLLKVCPPIYAIVHAVMQSKKHRRSSTMQEEGLTNDHRYYLHKASARLTRHCTITAGVLPREKCPNSLEMHPPLSLRSPLRNIQTY